MLIEGATTYPAPLPFPVPKLKPFAPGGSDFENIQAFTDQPNHIFRKGKGYTTNKPKPIEGPTKTKGRNRL